MQVLFLCLLATIAQAFVEKVERRPHQPTSNGTQLISFNNVQSGDFAAEKKSFNWIQDPAREGQFVKLANGSLITEDIVTSKQHVLIPAAQVPKDVHGFWFNRNVTKILWSTNTRKQYRYSYFADYLIQDVQTKKSEPLAVDQKNDIQYAVWSPHANSNVIAFVRGNNIFLWKDGKTTQITNNGGPNMFNGVPDWVYEEEILETNYALWFNAAGDKIAYLSINETGVPTYRVQHYMDQKSVQNSVAQPYPQEQEIRYPKAGATNPTVTASLLNVNWGSEGPKPMRIPIDQYEPNDLIIGEVAWLNARVALRLFNRVQDQSKLLVYDAALNTFKVTRTQDGTDGWLDNHKALKYVGMLSGENGKDLWSMNGCCEEYYLDKTDLSNWDHFYLMPTNYLNNDFIPLSWGDYDVREVLHVDMNRHLIYYTATETHPTESHIYVINVKRLERSAVTDTTKPAFHTASFTPHGAYYVLNYEGPNVPYQELYSVNDTKQPIRTITSNKPLIDKLAQYKLPRIRYADLKNPLGNNLSAMLRYPANFDPNKQYPLLFTPYGGPGAQEVTKKMQPLDFKTYIASDPELEYITFTLDGRGTGMRGREFRATVAHNLGQNEAEDQIWAAQQLVRTNKFIDRNKIAIWGWSYGGYLSAKVVEADSGVFSMALITAPVSDWRLYDSMYTERYMGLPSTNAANYTHTAVKRVDGFKHIAGGVLLQHGTGDDNVHFQNSAALVDALVGGGVGPDKLEVQYFTDSDHSISYNGANRFVYKQLAKRLFEEKMRVVSNGTAQQAHQWQKRASRVVERVGMAERLERFMKKLDGGEEMSMDSRMLLPGQIQV